VTDPSPAAQLAEHGYRNRRCGDEDYEDPERQLHRCVEGRRDDGEGTENRRAEHRYERKDVHHAGSHQAADDPGEKGPFLPRYAR
jgi:hypothetical protein